MNRNEFHYSFTAALLVEALDAKNIPRAEAAQLALTAARADAMVDWLTPLHLAGQRRPLTQATQIRVAEAGKILIGKGSWPIMERVDRFHFITPNGVPDPKLLQENPVLYGVKLHTFQDVGLPGCPHWGYVGYPDISNWNRSKKLGKISFWEQALGAIKPLRKLIWGHALDPDADQVQNCRKGALDTSIAVWESITNLDIIWRVPDESGKESLPFRLEQGSYYRIESLIAVMHARNDDDLVHRSKRIFYQVTKTDLPPFRPFGVKTTEWAKLLEAVK